MNVVNRNKLLVHTIWMNAYKNKLFGNIHIQSMYKYIQNVNGTYNISHDNPTTTIISPPKCVAEIVIARYNETLEWVHDHPFQHYDYIVYNKSDNRNFEITSKCTNIIQLPNVGREPHTYLYHIIQNYDNLKDITIFLSGSIDSPNKYDRAKRLMLEIPTSQSSVLSGFFQSTTILRGLGGFYVDEYACTNERNRVSHPESKIQVSKLRPYGYWYVSTFGDNEHSRFATYNSMFAIRKTDILQHPKSYYEKLIRQIDNHSNPEESHYFERSWEVVFYPLKNVKYV